MFLRGAEVWRLVIEGRRGVGMVVGGRRWVF